MENIKRISDELILEGQKETGNSNYVWNINELKERFKLNDEEIMSVIEELYGEVEKNVLEMYIDEDEIDLTFFYGRCDDMINLLDDEEDEYEEYRTCFKELEKKYTYLYDELNKHVIFTDKSLGTIKNCLSEKQAEKRVRDIIYKQVDKIL